MKKSFIEKMVWTFFQHQGWKLYLVATEKGLCYADTVPFSTYSKRFGIHEEPIMIHDDRKLQSYVTEYIEYFQGERQMFTFPLDLHGTPFQQSVWNALRAIPYGQCCSYSDVAMWIKKPTAVRAVGAAIGANPILISVPCHRVIGKDGSLTGFRGGLDMKRQLLQLEGALPLD